MQTWVFDVDGCIVDSLTGTSLRPRTLEVLTLLRAVPHRVLLWSAGGAAYARRRAEEHGIAAMFDGFHDKGGRDEHGRYVTRTFLDDHRGVVFVDDHPEDLPRDGEVVAVAPYLAPDPRDDGLRQIARRVVSEQPA